ncbi:uroporphyrinogen-III synthase [Nakamurella flava]|uniref:uroporphyrinogen-III synthase n=1 Tax=Nakamurella flava TaxID=2576308 RepID=UPI0014093F00|nr:uroporphyrinogen-III synthase [Nakamurella flava]
MTVLVPAPADPGAGPSGLHRALLAAGAEVTAVRLITVAAPPDTAALDAAVRRWADGRYTWIAFTSASTVAVWSARLDALGLPRSAASRIAAVGPATARAVGDAGWPVDLVPATGGSAEDLAAIWPPPADRPTATADVLLPHSDRAAATLPEALADAGHRIETVVAYRTMIGPPAPTVVERLVGGGFTAALFTSPSTVQAIGPRRPAAATVIGAIGRPTAEAVRAAGWRLDFTAAAPTPAALVDGLRRVLHRPPDEPPTTP